MVLATHKLPMTGGARDSLIAMSILWLLFALNVGFRFRGRLRGPGLGLDDTLAIVALILSTSTIGLNATVFTAGVGYDFVPTSHVYPDLVHNLPFIMQITFAFTMIYIWCLAFLKLSQLALYLRVFNRQLRNLVYIVGTIVILWAVIFNFVFIFLCNPIAQQWTVYRTGRCFDQILVLKFVIMTNLITDLLIVALPVRCVWQLQMRKTEKFAVLACFGLGLACVVISIARFILMYTIDLVGNLTGTSLTTFMLCTVELMLAGLCINIPMLRPYYLQWRAKYKSSATDSKRRQSELKLSGTGPLKSGSSRSGHYTQWLELRDKDQTHVTVTHDDASSERKLTAEQPDDAIHVSKNWVVTRD
ncbi:uncharacterized protein K460DRAFT_323779 [Cucurbitaria berberidis CBS 394.84]|uniref:Rhodopsin domain-containing protein n=1 Tax=Cucurbitaria berberidis CBS 394.84 TaxID=1168544 RepID=A0A9P4L376_9PLEO|nr:uncharacterized protein K460DRAFT_323779 [Cucurbitaria berberidis CBS 394.84]KAF1839992.1 hypothetical protein K460DRAFT_323779 [Cucurbitaria berberidis CBS 394.84]